MISEVLAHLWMNSNLLNGLFSVGSQKAIYACKERHDTNKEVKLELYCFIVFL